MTLSAFWNMAVPKMASLFFCVFRESVESSLSWLLPDAGDDALNFKCTDEIPRSMSSREQGDECGSFKLTLDGHGGVNATADRADNIAMAMNKKRATISRDAPERET